MSAKSSGLLIHFDESRRSDLIKDRLESYSIKFTEALSIPDWNIRELSVALLSFSDLTIDYIALAKRGNRVVTSKYRVEFSELLNLGSIPYDAIEEDINTRVRSHFIKSSQGMGAVLPIATWLALIESIKKARPTLVEEIDRLISLQRYSGLRLYGDAAEILLQEREAVGISLDIFTGNSQLRNGVLSQWAPSDGTVIDLNEIKATGKLITGTGARSSFLSGISKRYIQEESAIQHDLYNWPGMTPVHEAGISVFELGERRLEVMYANRNALEHTLGVDLIYYKEAYGLFVLVQYKLMKEEGDRLLYRPDDQLALELERMDHFHSSIKMMTAITSHLDYRLCEDGFLFKCVPNTGLKPAAGELIKGMYIPREYMHFLLGPMGPKGPQGGIQISFDNSPRYLTNSEFSSNVHAGRIGTRGVHTSKIKEIVAEYYESGRALIVSREVSNGNANSVEPQIIPKDLEPDEETSRYG